MLTDAIEILIQAAGEGFEWLRDTAEILIAATPDFGLPPLFLMAGSAFIIFMGWELINERR